MCGGYLIFRGLLYYNSWCLIFNKKSEDIQRNRKIWLIPSNKVQFSSLHRVGLSATPWTAACQASLFITNSWKLPKLMSIELVMPSNYLILCHPFLLPSIFPSIRVFPMSQFFASDVHMYWCYGLNRLLSLQFTCGSLNLHVTVSGDRALKEAVK